MARIELVVQMRAFHKRFHWMLSGLTQQIDPPDFSVTVAIDAADPYTDRLQGLKDVFPSLTINWVEYNSPRFNMRGLTRDDALQASDSEWLIFSDADMIYHPDMMRLLGEHAGKPDAQDAISSVVRVRTTQSSADGVVSAADYATPIDAAYEKSLKLYADDPYKVSVARATGYFQMCRRDKALERGTYCQNHAPKDMPLGAKNGGECLSDVQFRRGWKIIKPLLPPLVHLTHARGWKGESTGECL